MVCRIGQNKIERPSVDIDPRHADLELVPQSMTPAGASADQGVGLGFQVVVVIAQARDVDQPLDRQLDQAAEEAEVLDAR